MILLRWAAPLVITALLRADGSSVEGPEFFEKRVRPVLVRNCYACHSAALQTPMGDLRLDSREAMLRGGKSGAAVVPGYPDRSPLISALNHGETIKMPPSGKLPAEQIADIVAWVRIGAPVPVKGGKAGAHHWAFQPVRDSQPPPVKNGQWVRSPIDNFILAKLEAAGLSPTGPADKRSLIRRVTYDLIGLPPSPAEVKAFLKDESPEAFRRIVERLLASPHYGERWARHWLDLVRYAETNGHEYDNDKLAPWLYRDYVIRAFNQDVPYDQFVREHIAGDLLPRKRLTADGAAQDSLLGTTFFWFGEVLNSATDSVKSRADEVDNQIDVMGKTFQGLTIACARCHDHKFDPIPTADYYALAGVLHSTDLREAAIDAPERARDIEEFSRKIRAINAKIDEVTGAAAPARPVFKYRAEDVPFERFETGFGEWLPSGAAFTDVPVHGAASSLAAGSDRFVGTLTSPKFRTTSKLYLHVRVSGTKSDAKLKERGLLRFTIIADGYKGQHIVADGKPSSGWKTLRLTFERNRTCYFEIVDHSRFGYIAVDEIVFSDSKEPPPTDEPAAPGPAMAAPPGLLAEREALERQIPPSAFAMLAADRDPRNVRIHVRGNHTSLGDEVPRGFLKLVSDQTRIGTGSGRSEVAEWIASPKNPLTARVMVNRVWKHHFGRGIVRTPDNFGATGDPPTHPELLDYLAARFVESGWSVKALHRILLLSSAYQMSSAAPEAAAKSDPENKLLHHMPVRRLEGEAIRDALLAVAGTLNPKMFGPSVTPHIGKHQDGRGKPVSGPLDGDGRRSIYIQARRNFLTPMLLAFDYPLPISSIGARGVSTVPSQALMMMNNEFVEAQSREWGRRIIAVSPDARARVDAMYLAAFARPAEPVEVDEILGFVRERGGVAEDQVWSDVAHVLFNSPEFIYVR